MAVGPLARLVTRIASVAGNMVGKAVVNVYKDAAKQATQAAAMAAATRKMPVEEAHKILGLDSAELHDTEARDILAEHYKKLYELNSPNPPDFYGSPYIQTRVEHAYKVALQEIQKAKNADTAKAGN
ncbi:hypothetical protein FOZ63_028218 [Perkinsus olseni]|uniref:Mitochondrial import inner membrane translocase subunit TIM16 n=1 Tax=Perkinsus olseni TaxID=32597 RepID=A0A7J6RZP8_PEROL|nr:hypothetical protein FOZ62_000135 [Perkinsus olseni]KAF4759292.1 hypothetical protein FOZ63_028218 [Perkinsus olseni]